jgi:hypothetical protein
MVAGNAIGMLAKSVQIIPDHLRHFKNVQRGETQNNLSIGIATVVKKEKA